MFTRGNWRPRPGPLPTRRRVTPRPDHPIACCAQELTGRIGGGTWWISAQDHIPHPAAHRLRWLRDRERRRRRTHSRGRGGCRRVQPLRRHPIRECATPPFLASKSTSSLLTGILAPLTAITDLPTHPTLSRPLTSKAHTEHSSQGSNWMHKENSA